MANAIDPALLDQWFSPERQRYYIDRLLQEQRGLTRRRAESFIRLWAYLMLKQQGSVSSSSISTLLPLAGAVSCTHREAAELFYTDKEKGSDRAAGMMINQLVNLGLVSKTFDGNTTSLHIRILPELTQPSPEEVPVTLYCDQFDPRTDAVPVASFLARNYNWITSSTATTARKIAKLLRQWAQQYPVGMRVLRRTDNFQPVGFYILFPVASASEENFFQPPRLSLHLSTAQDVDPIKMALPGDADCLSIFVRSWMIDTPYMQHAYICQSLSDAQNTLVKLQKDFPNICDLYAIAIHPNYAALAQTLGFQKTVQDPQSPLSWLYLALDRFLALDIETAISRLSLPTS